MSTLIATVIPDAPAPQPDSATSVRWWQAAGVSRRAAVATLATVGGSALLLSKLGLGNTPQLRKTEWRTLSPVSPELLLWSDHSEQMQFHLGEHHTLELASEDLALLHLGRPVTGVFTLAVDLLHTEAQARGVFFQTKTDYTKSPPTLQFQTLELITPSEVASTKASPTGSPVPGLPVPTPPHLLLWSQWRTQNENGKLTTQRTSLAEIEVNRAQNNQSLQITCGRQGMPEIVWNGQLLHETQWRFSIEGAQTPTAFRTQLSTAYLGRLGLLNVGGRSTFHQPRLAYL